jgi:hypothetical protein
MKAFAVLIFLATIAVSGCDKSPTEKKVESVDEQLKSAKIELERKNYGKTIEITIKITQSDPKNVEAYYLESQAQALAGSIKEAMKSLEAAIKNGFKDFKGLMENKNFDAIKQAPEFELLMQRYNPDAAAKASITDKEVKAGDTSIKEENGQQVIKAGDIEIKIPKD